MLYLRFGVSGPAAGNARHPAGSGGMMEVEISGHAVGGSMEEDSSAMEVCWSWNGAGTKT
jgi:hypothetical protein